MKITTSSKHLAPLALGVVLAAGALAACADEPQTIDPAGTTGNTTTTTAVGPGSGGGSGDGGNGSGPSGPGGTQSGPTGGQQTGEEMFVENVYPLLDAPTDSGGLACTSCHGAGTNGAPIFFAPTGAAASYNSITGYVPSMIATPDNSNLVLHGPHAGPALDSDQRAAVIEWLNQEVIERGLDGGEGGGAGTGGASGGTGGGEPEGPVTLAIAMEQFGDCMQLADWEQTGMNLLPESQTEIGSCQGCHGAGDAGTWLSANDLETFEKNRIYPYIRRLITGTVDENGAFDTLIPSRRYIEHGQECGGENQNCHPQYILPPDTEQAVVDFVDITLERWEAGPCDPEDIGVGGGGGAPPQP